LKVFLLSYFSVVHFEGFFAIIFFQLFNVVIHTPGLELNVASQIWTFEQPKTYESNRITKTHD
jgi:hypothetical protein